MTLEAIEVWAAGILANRAEKRWEPVIKVSPKVARSFSKLAGHPVQIDKNLDEEERKNYAVKIYADRDVTRDGETEPYIKAGDLCARMIIS